MSSIDVSNCTDPDEIETLEVHELQGEEDSGSYRKVSFECSSADINDIDNAEDITDNTEDTADNVEDTSQQEYIDSLYEWIVHSLSEAQERLQQYGSRCEWLKDDKFLRDLEGDSVDTEILDEELRSLQEDEPKTCRGKTVKFLESNPFQIVLCVLVLVDAGVVIAEILLDLHAIRGQYREATDDLLQALSFLKVTYSDELHGYNGTDMEYILDKLKRRYNNNQTQPKMRNRRSVNHLPPLWPPIGFANMLDMQLLDEDQVDDLIALGVDTGWGERTWGTESENARKPPELDIKTQNSDTHYYSRIMQYLTSIATYSDAHAETVDTAGAVDTADTAHNVGSKNSREERSVQHVRERSERATEEDMDGTVGYANDDVNATNTKDYKAPTKYKTKSYTYAEKLLKIAHILHYCSIAILGIFVVQLLLKIYAMGAEFFRKRMEIFDGVIILASFALDLVFLEGIVGVQGEEAAALLVMFLLWRILRVINGILVTAKKRQEFRIKLQKRARRRAEKKIELMEEDKQLREKEICALRDLCQSKGAVETEVSACKPRRRSIFQKMDTSAGLSSIAALSLGFSMSMSGGGGGMFNSQASQQGGSNPVLNSSRKDSVADIMTLPPRLRRQSLAALPLQNIREKSPLKITVRPSSMEKVVEEPSPEEEEEKKNPPSPPTKNGKPPSPCLPVIRRSFEGVSAPNSLPSTSLLPPGCTTGKQVTFELEVETNNKPQRLRGSHESILSGKTLHPKKTTLVNNGPLSSNDLKTIGRSVSDRAIHRLSPKIQDTAPRRSSDSGPRTANGAEEKRKIFSNDSQKSTESDHSIANHIEVNSIEAPPPSTRI